MSRMNELVVSVTEDLESGIYTPEELADKWRIPVAWVLVLVQSMREAL
jgi:hypothetical protein